MAYYDRGPVRIHYEDRLRLSAAADPRRRPQRRASPTSPVNGPFNTVETLKGEYRCITMDLRNANGSESKGPLEIDRPWDAYTDDHLGLMDHLGIKDFMVMGFCIGAPFIWNMLKRASDRVVAAVLAQPSGFRPELPDLFYNNNMNNWGPNLVQGAARNHDGHGLRLPEKHVRHQPRLRLHRDA